MLNIAKISIFIILVVIPKILHAEDQPSNSSNLKYNLVLPNEEWREITNQKFIKASGITRPDQKVIATNGFEATGLISEELLDHPLKDTDSEKLYTQSFLFSTEGLEYIKIASKANIKYGSIKGKKYTYTAYKQGSLNYYENIIFIVDKTKVHLLFWTYSSLKDKYIKDFSFITRHLFSKTQDLNLYEEKLVSPTELEVFENSIQKMKPIDIVKSYDNSIYMITALDSHDEIIGSGSGFTAIRDNFVITNYHVIDNASSIIVKDINGNEYTDAKLLAGSPEVDIAILTIKNLKSVKIKFSHSSLPQKGDTVYAIGSPIEYQNTISDGLLSAKREVNGVPIYQITAPISPGSSGGPLINDKGQLIGVCFAYDDKGQNLNFAVPAQAVLVLYEKSEKAIPLSEFNNNVQELKVKLLNEMLNKSKDNYQVWSKLGLAYYYQKNYEKSFECFRKAIEINENDAESYYFLARIYENSQRYDEATQIYKILLEDNNFGARALQRLQIITKGN